MLHTWQQFKSIYSEVMNKDIVIGRAGSSSFPKI